MRYVRKLEEYEAITLKEMEKNHKKPYIRKKAEIIRLSNQAYCIVDIEKMLKQDRNTISSTITNYEKYGFAGFYDDPRPGRPPIITETILDFIKEELNSDKIANSSSLKASIKELFDIDVHPNSIKYQLKKRFRYKKFRFGLKHKRNQEAFEEAQEALEKMKSIAEKGLISLIYLDESGFASNLPTTSTWSKIGEEKTIPMIDEKYFRINVLGLYDYGKDSLTYAYIDSTVNTTTFWALFKDIFSGDSIPTYIILDNASHHTSKISKEMIEEFEKDNVFFIFLPPYSPELNLIENIWNMIKYKYMKQRSFKDYSSLETNLIEAFDKFNKKCLNTFC